jgi:hypothetical protein
MGGGELGVVGLRTPPPPQHTHCTHTPGTSWESTLYLTLIRGDRGVRTPGARVGRCGCSRCAARRGAARRGAAGAWSSSPLAFDEGMPRHLTRPALIR